MWHVNFCLSKVFLVREVFSIEVELGVYKSRLNGRYKIVKSVWVRIEEQLILLYILKEFVTNCTKEMAQNFGKEMRDV